METHPRQLKKEHAVQKRKFPPSTLRTLGEKNSERKGDRKIELKREGNCKKKGFGDSSLQTEKGII